tara:strand:- start:5574 stop:5951 length:378 start_codon:yes stop_codon:yes gene_type:complete
MELAGKATARATERLGLPKPFFMPSAQGCARPGSSVNVSSTASNTPPSTQPVAAEHAVTPAISLRRPTTLRARRSHLHHAFEEGRLWPAGRQPPPRSGGSGDPISAYTSSGTRIRSPSITSKWQS